MNKFTLYVDSDTLNSDFVIHCQQRLNSDKSEVIVFEEGKDFDNIDLEIESYPALKFTFIDNNKVIHENFCKNFEESYDYLKRMYLI